jgi:hypothetical protein
MVSSFYRSAFFVPPGSGFRKTAQEVLDGLRIILITPQARLSILEREVGYA